MHTSAMALAFYILWDVFIGTTWPEPKKRILTEGKNLFLGEWPCRPDDPPVLGPTLAQGPSPRIQKTIPG